MTEQHAPRENKTRITLVVLLILSFTLNTVLACVLFKAPKGIVGTYCDGDQRVPSTRYLALVSDGQFVLYRQFEVIETGIYSAGEDEVYHLTTQTVSFSMAYIADDTIYLSSKDGSMASFYRIGDIPTMINLPDFRLPLPDEL